MKYKILFFLFLILVCFLPIQVSANIQREQVARQIEIIKHKISVLQMLIVNMSMRRAISSPSYLAVNIHDNSILLEKNSNQIHSIASITKLITAVIASENINADETIILTKEMLKPLGRSPVLFAGLNMAMKNLSKASIIQSTNDASEALTHFLGKEKFIKLMNEKAKEIGMNNTIFYDAHGLNPANKSTAQDLVKLMSYIYQNHPDILTISKNNDFWLPDPRGIMLKFQNVNNFYLLPGFIGGKTGFLPEAKQTMASIFNFNGDPIAIIVLRSNNRQADIFTILRNLK